MRDPDGNVMKDEFGVAKMEIRQTLKFDSRAIALVAFLQRVGTDLFAAPEAPERRRAPGRRAGPRGRRRARGARDHGGGGRKGPAVTLLALLTDWLGEDWLGVLSTTGMLIFFTVFVGVLIWIATRSRRQIDRWSKLPLEDDLNESGESDEKDESDRI